MGTSRRYFYDGTPDEGKLSCPVWGGGKGIPYLSPYFSDERRHEIFSYMIERYGQEHVAQIITFGTLASRAAIRDVGRALNIANKEIDQIAKAIPFGKSLTEVEGLEKKFSYLPYFKKLLAFSKKIEGFPRHYSTHAAGMVMTSEPLTMFVPVQQQEEGLLTQYAMNDLSKIGILKMDFLALKTLSILDHTIARVEEKIVLEEIPWEDEKTFSLLSQGKTLGIFQLESSGIRRVLEQLKPNHFADIIAVLALYRPGPMKFIPTYIACKHQHKMPEYLHPVLEPILKDTHGIILYQEQIVQIAAKMAGFSFGQADILRRAISKKDHKILKQEEEHFIKGCIAQGFKQEIAAKIYAMIFEFANYGFPKAHATAYGRISWQMAYLKAHYAAAFMAAIIQAHPDKLELYVKECRSLELNVLKPHINESTVEITITKTSLRLGLTSINHVNSNIATHILEVKEQNGAFLDVEDFCYRIDPKICPLKVTVSLIQAGAFEGLRGNQKQWLHIIGELYERVSHYMDKKNSLNIDLLQLGLEEVGPIPIELSDMDEPSSLETANFEKQALGLSFAKTSLEKNLDISDGFVSQITRTKTITTKKGTPMTFVTLQNQELIWFSEAPKWLVKDQYVIFFVRPDRNQIEQMVPVFLGDNALKLHIRIPKEKENSSLLVQLKEGIQEFPGTLSVVLVYDKTKKAVALSETFQVSLSAAMIKKLEKILGKDNLLLK